MATKKPAAKKAAPAKPAAKKSAAKPVAKKPAPKPVAKKSAARPVVKSPVAKPLAKKTVSKTPSKPLPKKETAKPVATPVKPAPEKKQQVQGNGKAGQHAVTAVQPTVEKAVAPKTAAKPEPIKEVKVPKTTVKTSVPYQPGYTPLEKRADTPKTNEPLVRYSDNELGEFRDHINKKLEAAKKELAYLQGLITRKDDMGGDDTDNRYVTMEDGSMSMEREQLSQMASRQITYIDHLEKALIRIENKTYGICRVTGKLIDKARLRAVPHATLSLEAKLGYVKPNDQ